MTFLWQTSGPNDDQMTIECFAIKPIKIQMFDITLVGKWSYAMS